MLAKSTRPFITFWLHILVVVGVARVAVGIETTDSIPLHINQRLCMTGVALMRIGIETV